MNRRDWLKAAGVAASISSVSYAAGVPLTLQAFEPMVLRALPIAFAPSPWPTRKAGLSGFVPQSGLLTRENQPKESYERLRKLIASWQT